MSCADFAGQWGFMRLTRQSSICQAAPGGVSFVIAGEDKERLHCILEIFSARVFLSDTNKHTRNKRVNYYLNMIVCTFKPLFLSTISLASVCLEQGHRESHMSSRPGGESASLHIHIVCTSATGRLRALTHSYSSLLPTVPYPILTVSSIYQ